jgi:N-acyl-phosphatidylethanolamine-hydrolysing phospholipase D
LGDGLMTQKLVPTLLFLAVLFFLGSCARTNPAFDEARWRHDVESRNTEDLYAPHYRDGRYFNPWMPMEAKSFWELLMWRLSRKEAYTEEEESFRPSVIPALKERILSMPEGDFITWIGHATFLMRINGEYWLTDPIFSERALLPKRKTPPAMTLEDMKGVSGKLNILISHNHYDHFDKPSVRGLSESARVFVPLGLKSTVEQLNKANVVELDWWQSIDCGNGIKVICLPAQHWSRRISQGTDKTLWASFMIVTPTVTIYFGADSGYFIGYREIGRLYPNIDYALLPTTAYHPRWFMHYAHVNVREAIDAFNDLGARYMVPTQWGTFHLGDEPIGYSILELKRTIQKEGLDPSRFVIMDIGQIVPIAGK